MGHNESSHHKDERRRAPRIKGTVVEYSLDQNGPFDKTAFMKDISLSGIGVCFDQNVEPATKLFLKIYFPGKQNAILASGRIAWEKKSGFLNYFDAGIEFIDMDEENKSRLLDYIEKSRHTGG